ncbi:MAG: hypothetical protein ACREJX_11975 [Polyangiaceae bacterium]
MKNILVSAMLCVAILTTTHLVRAQTTSPAPAASATVDLSAQRIRQIFTANRISEDWFNAEFLKKVPLSKIQEVVDQLKFGLGQFKAVKKSDEPNENQFPVPWGRYVATFKDGTDEIYVHLDDVQKINGLSMKTPHTSF